MFEGKWVGSFNEFLLDCILYVVWDFFLDWLYWDRFCFGKIVVELCEGENRKLGVVCFYDYLDDGFWIIECLLIIDEDEYILLFNIENYIFFGGVMIGYNGWVKVKFEIVIFFVIY